MLLAGRSLIDADDALADLVDPRVGIIRSCTQVAKHWSEPPRPVVYQAILSNFDFRRVPVLERIASGKALTAGESRRGAIVEALERYCALQRRPGALVTAPAGSLDAPAIAPEELVLFSEQQYRRPGFRYRRPVSDATLTWVAAKRLGDGGRVYAPASLVYMNFAGDHASEFFAQTSTSGLSGGADIASAVLGALREVVERDAYTITWLARLPAPRIDFDGSDGIATEISRHYERFGIEVIAFDVTTDLDIPVVMAIGFDRSGGLPAAVVGLGCDLDPSSALDRAMMEVVQVRTGLVPYFRREPVPEPIERYEDVHSINDHAAFAGDPANAHEFDFLLEGRAHVRLDELPDRRAGSVDEDLEYCRARLEAAGSTVAYVDLTMPDLEPFPLRVVRAIATGLQPIHFGFGEERLGGTRPFTVPRLLGYRDRDLSEEDLNPCPHPLA
jgi:ribosomal protein S12 methylthiotransferase accessory factor